MKRPMKDIYIPPSMTAIQALQVLSAWKKDPEERALMTLSCHDMDDAPRVKDAGMTKKIGKNSVQIMHNGIVVVRDGYQGSWESMVIEGLRGVHEPQEEKVFMAVLERLKGEANPIMLELGSWWSYYSLWFLKALGSKAKAFCGEPDPDNIVLGKTNAQLNGFKIGKDIEFMQFASGAKDVGSFTFTTEKGFDVSVPLRTVDSVLSENNIPELSVLHFDIQGAELDTLHGALRSIKNKKIRYIFISTHHYSISGDPNIHQKCVDFIKSCGGHIIAKHTVLESCSGDGLIVASFSDEDAHFTVDISFQPQDDSLYRQSEEDTSLLCDYYERLRKTHFYEIDKRDEEIKQLKSRIDYEVNKVKELEEIISDVTPLRKYIKKHLRDRITKK